MAVATLLPRANEGMQVGRGGRARGGGRGGAGGRGLDRGTVVCVCVCVCVRARSLSHCLARAADKFALSRLFHALRGLACVFW